MLVRQSSVIYEMLTIYGNIYFFYSFECSAMEQFVDAVIFEPNTTYLEQAC